MPTKTEITEEQRNELLIFSDLITAKNRMYTAEDVSKIYDLHNSIFKSTKRPNGCPSCLRATLRELHGVIKAL
jgi:hypothetical protein